MLTDVVGYATRRTRRSVVRLPEGLEEKCRGDIVWRKPSRSPLESPTRSTLGWYLGTANARNRRSGKRIPNQMVNIKSVDPVFILTHHTLRLSPSPPRCIGIRQIFRDPRSRLREGTSKGMPTAVLTRWAPSHYDTTAPERPLPSLTLSQRPSVSTRCRCVSAR